jgi:hypothetical protein
MGGADDAEIDFQRTDLPLFLVRAAMREEIDAEAAHDSVVGQDTPDPQTSVLNLRAIAVPSGKAAAQVDLTGGSAQELIVRGDEQDLAARTGAKLGARGSYLPALEKLSTMPPIAANFSKCSRPVRRAR